MAASHSGSFRQLILQLQGLWLADSSQLSVPAETAEVPLSREGPGEGLGLAEVKEWEVLRPGPFSPTRTWTIFAPELSTEQAER